MLRSKLRFNFLPDSAVLKLTRSGLAAGGIAVANVTARAVAPGPGAFAGVVVALDGDPPRTAPHPTT